jgi:hypothetical protein
MNLAFDDAVFGLSRNAFNVESTSPAAQVAK